MPQPMHAAPLGALPATHWQPIGFPADWRSDPVSDRYLSRFLDLAARHGITVGWVLTPLNPALQSECERVGFDETYLKYVRDWQARYANMIVIDGRHAEYDPSVFASDPVHLARAGAFVFSNDLGALFAAARRDAKPALEHPAALSRVGRRPGYRRRSLGTAFVDASTRSATLTTPDGVAARGGTSTQPSRRRRSNRP